MFSKGLEGVIADESSIGLVNGEAGELYYRGYAIGDLVLKKTFDETAYMLLFGDFPNPEQLASYQRRMAEHRALEPHVRKLVESLPVEAHPMEALQAILAVLGAIRPGQLRVRRVTGSDGKKKSVLEPPELLEQDAFRVLGAIPTVIASFYKLQSKQPLPEPRADLGYLENFLYMFNGTVPSKEDLHVFGICETLQMEHGFNASTFTARVVASTLAPLHTSLSSAIGGLCGILHGGADEAAFLMARDEVGTPDKAEAYVNAVLSRGERIMGVGHREYKTIDPRATALKGLAEKFCAGKGGESERIFRTLLAVEAAVAVEMTKKGQRIHPNVEFYKGTVFYALGVPPRFFTSMFVLARAFGWVANILELAQDHRIYRPTSQFLGEVGRPVPG